MRRALALAATPGVPLGPNPRVGCVLLDDDGHDGRRGLPPRRRHPARRGRRAGPRRRAGPAAPPPSSPSSPATTAAAPARARRRWSTPAYDGWCSPSPTPTRPRPGEPTPSAPPASTSSAGLLDDEARALNRVWTFAVEHGRPFVTWKFATTLDGRSAAADGTSRWVSSPAARIDTHRLRALCDVMLVGTNTVEVDDPLLTVRDEHDQPLADQPLRAVMGERDLDPGRRIFNADAETVHLRTRDPKTALAELYARDRQHVFLEGGPTLAAAFLRAGLVDEIVVYVAPMLLGAGRTAVADLGITTIADAFRPRVADITVLGRGDEPNVRLTLEPEGA